MVNPITKAKERQVDNDSEPNHSELHPDNKEKMRLQLEAQKLAEETARLQREREAEIARKKAKKENKEALKKQKEEERELKRKLKEEKARLKKLE